jgi:hypothetical protein
MTKSMERHAGRGPCAPTTRDAHQLWGIRLPTHAHHPPGGHQQYEPVSLRPLGSLHLGLMEVAATAPGSEPFCQQRIESGISPDGATRRKIVARGGAGSLPTRRLQPNRLSLAASMRKKARSLLAGKERPTIPVEGGTSSSGLNPRRCGVC